LGTGAIGKGARAGRALRGGSPRRGRDRMQSRARQGLAGIAPPRRMAHWGRRR